MSATKDIFGKPKSAPSMVGTITEYSILPYRYGGFFPLGNLDASYFLVFNGHGVPNSYTLTLQRELGDGTRDDLATFKRGQLTKIIVSSRSSQSREPLLMGSRAQVGQDPRNAIFTLVTDSAALKKEAMLFTNQLQRFDGKASPFRTSPSVLANVAMQMVADFRSSSSPASGPRTSRNSSTVSSGGGSRAASSPRLCREFYFSRCVSLLLMEDWVQCERRR